MSDKLTPEFSHIVKVAELVAKKTTFEIEASAAERAALADRFDLAGIEKMAAKLTLQLAGNGEVTVRGTLHAEITQRCVVTLEPVPEIVDDEIEVLYSPHVSEENMPSTADDLEGLTEDELMALLDQPEPLTDGIIDLGEVAAQFLAISMDPYPRKEGVDIEEFVENEEAEEKPNPFAKLAGLKDKLENKNEGF
ncbi:YceD family protein [Thalassospira mesophila]|uniref:Phosphodiesterase n=1 Tax=Thalassospira mesophila TaxID=1293891 RepID=A0A1Y2KZH1_9PROT|nr:YceD family protein [Thalassospira mesophila]OSQ37855.1 hypothetical protein TMES_12760 [Thalassospira mesophila]